MSIRNRLTLIISVLIGVLAFQGVFNLYFRSINNQLTENLASGVATTAEVGAISTEVQKMRRFEKEYFIYVDNADKRRGYDADVRKASGVITESLTRMMNNRDRRYSEAQVAKFKKWEADLAFYTQQFIAVVNKVENGEIKGTVAANAAIGPGKDRIKDLIDGSAKFGGEMQKTALVDAKSLNDNRGNASAIFAVTSALAIIVGLISLAMLRAAIVRPLEEMTDVADRVSKGDLGVVFPEQHAHEFALLAESLERMRGIVNRSRAARAPA
jgi:HAMP domain-containing protein